MSRIWFYTTPKSLSLNINLSVRHCESEKGRLSLTVPRDVPPRYRGLFFSRAIGKIDIQQGIPLEILGSSFTTRLPSCTRLELTIISRYLLLVHRHDGIHPVSTLHKQHVVATLVDVRLRASCSDSQ